MINCSKIAIFGPKMSQKAPGPHWDPQDPEKFFFELPGYNNPMLEKKNFWIISHRKKSWSDHSKALGAILVFGAAARWIRNLAEKQS